MVFGLGPCLNLCVTAASLRLCGKSNFQVHESTQNHRRDAENAKDAQSLTLASFLLWFVLTSEVLEQSAFHGV